MTDPGDVYCTKVELDDYCTATVWRWEDGKRLPCPNPRYERLGGLIAFCEMHWLDVEVALRNVQLRPVSEADIERNLWIMRQKRLATAQAALAEDAPAPGGFVYFIQSGEDGPIKIGTSRKPRVRFLDLQVASPHPLFLRAVEPGGRELERVYHARFAAYRLNGEWFRPVPEVLEAVEDAASR